MAFNVVPGSGRASGKGFLASLLDFELSSFVTLKFLKVVYAVLVVLIGIFAVVGTLGSLYDLVQGDVEGLLGLVVVPLATLFLLVLARMYVEFGALFFRIGQDVSTLARTAERPTSPPPLTVPGGPSGGWGPPPQASGGH